MMLNLPSYSQDYWNKGNPMSVLGWSHYYQFWAYPNDLEISRLEYKLDKAKLISNTPKGIHS